MSAGSVVTNQSLGAVNVSGSVVANGTLLLLSPNGVFIQPTGNVSAVHFVAAAGNLASSGFRAPLRYELQGCNHPVFAANASRCFTLFCKDRRLTPARPGTDIARGGFELQLSCTQLREAWVRLNLTRAELEHWGGMSRRAGRGVSARSRRSVANESTWEAALRGCR